jgi:hypothetical protein
LKAGVDGIRLKEEYIKEEVKSEEDEDLDMGGNIEMYVEEDGNLEEGDVAMSQ